MTLTEFLTARLDKDEATARALLPYHPAPDELLGPARVLREVQAKRAIAAVYSDHPDYNPEWA